MRHGEVVESGTCADVMTRPSHPYTGIAMAMPSPATSVRADAAAGTLLTEVPGWPKLRDEEPWGKPVVI